MSNVSLKLCTYKSSLDYFIEVCHAHYVLLFFPDALLCSSHLRNDILTDTIPWEFRVTRQCLIADLLFYWAISERSTSQKSVVFSQIRKHNKTRYFSDNYIVATKTKPTLLLYDIHRCIYQEKTLQVTVLKGKYRPLKRHCQLLAPTTKHFVYSLLLLLLDNNWQFWWMWYITSNMQNYL